MKSHRILIAILIVLSLAGCAARVKMNLSVLSDKKIEKRDSLGEPVPVIIKVFQLRSADRFNQTYVEELFLKPEEMLKEDLVSVKKVKVDFFRGEYRKYRVEKGARFMGFVAKLQKERDNHAWKRIFVIGDEKLGDVKVDLKPVKKPGADNYVNMVIKFPSSSEKEQFDEFGEPIPAMIRIYQLKELALFDRASVTDLFKQGDKILAGELVARGKLKVNVDNALVKRVKVVPGARFFGMAAKLYKSGDNRFWKKSFPAESAGLKNISIVLTRDIPESLHVGLYPAPEMKLPTTFLFFRMTGREKFEEADFRALWRNGEKVLDGELLKVEKVHLYPGKPEEFTIPRKKELRFIGIAANFRKRAGESSWKKVIDLSKKPFMKTESVNLLVHSSGFEMEPVKGKK